MAEAHPTSSRSRLPLRTKLYIPLGRHHLVPRPRLSARLNESLARPLTLVSGPAGFGKTTLLSEWLLDLDVGESNLKRAWVSLDPGDNDPVRFLGYVIAALQTTMPDVGETAQASLAAPQPPPIESILAELLNDLYALPGELILVLDDYHVIDSAAVNNAISFLLDNLPPQMHLILSTRADPSRHWPSGVHAAIE